MGKVLGMRLARIKGRGGAVYHCVSRTVGGQLLLDEECKERVASLLMRLARLDCLKQYVQQRLIHDFIKRVPQNFLDQLHLPRMKIQYSDHSHRTQLRS